MTEFTAIFSDDNVGLVIKLFQLMLLALLVIFSLLTIRQVGIMNKSLVTPMRFEVRVIAYLQLFLTIGIFIVILTR
jgi:hypothetical protein